MEFFNLLSARLQSVSTLQHNLYVAAHVIIRAAGKIISVFRDVWLLQHTEHLDDVTGSGDRQAWQEDTVQSGVLKQQQPAGQKELTNIIQVFNNYRNNQ